MHKYEVLYILAGALENEKKDAFIDKYSKLVVKQGGVVDSINKWGMRKLAYPINYKNEGFYVLMTYQAKADFNAELERQFRIAKDEVIRFMVSRVITDDSKQQEKDSVKQKETKLVKAKKEKAEEPKIEEAVVEKKPKAEEAIVSTEEKIEPASAKEEPKTEAAEEKTAIKKQPKTEN